MKKNHVLLIINFLAFSCSDSETLEEAHTYHFSEKSKLTVSSREDSYMKYGVIGKGENTVFKYRFDAEEEENIADDEYGETIQFEIETGLREFSYSNSELSEIALVFTKYCFCYFPLEPSKNVPPMGSISGQKISNHRWKININVTFYGEESRTIEEIFLLNEDL